MQCPKCSLYHPNRYERCVSCGSALVEDTPGETEEQPVSTQAGRGTKTPPAPRAISGGGRNAGQPQRRGIPTAVGIAIAGFILCASAGGTFFYLTKPPESTRLLVEGQKQLKDGQIAFALKTLQEAQRSAPNDPRVMLALARAYVGVDQVDKAWDCITQAQALGAGVVSDPELATELASYYRQHNQYQRAVELLRGLASSNAPGKKAELCDLDAAWGDEALRNGDFKQAMQCWEEVKDLHDGSRFTEADTRLSTIYQKMGDDMAAKGDNEEALKYYAKLNILAPTGASLERTAELYQKDGKLELAIDQMRKAVKVAADPNVSTRKLAAMMVLRGKELLDSGDSDAGFGYLQQAQALDKNIRVPLATVRNAHIDLQAGGIVHFAGEVWNPGPDALSGMTVRTELFDTKAGKSLWSKDSRVIDEFVPPLAARDARAFDVVSIAPTTSPNTTEMRVYLNGALYKSYPVAAKRSASDLALTKPVIDRTSQGTSIVPSLRPRINTPDTSGTTTMPPVAPAVVNDDIQLPPVAPPAVPGTSAEEKTLKDLE